MRHLLTSLAALLLCFAPAPAQAQTLKSLMYNTNGQVVANTGTNVLTFPSNVKWGNGELSVESQSIIGSGVLFSFEDGYYSGPIYLETNVSIAFQGNVAATIRTNLNLGATWLTNTNLANFRKSILPSYSNNATKVLRLNATGTDIEWAEIAGGTNTNLLTLPLAITNGGTGANNAGEARTNLGLSGSLTAYSGNAGKVLRVNSSENNLELIKVPAESGSGPTSAILGPVSDGSVTATGSLSFVIGGLNNHASGVQAGIVGGGGNTSAGTNSIVVGGTSSSATKNGSFAGGGYAQATNGGAFVWSDSSATNAFSSTNDNSFNLRVAGGMSLDLGTNGIVFRNNNGITNTRKSIFPPYQTFTFTTNTNNVVTTNTNSFAGMALLVNSNATDVQWTNITRASIGFSTNVDSLWTATNIDNAKTVLGIDLSPPSDLAEFILRTNSSSRSSTDSDADEVLTYSFPSSGKYFVTLGHLMTVQTNSGLKARIISSNATVYGTWSFSASQLTNDYNYALGSVSGQRMFHQWFIVDASTNSSIALGWGQVSGTNTTSIDAGSFLKIEKFTPQ